ncbi:MAG TPA: glycosyltransferase [Pirellulales bacterium]|nr:glycosyltransferase [Pirellulales bacterium]
MSVLLPVWNEQRYLSDVLTSFLQQDYPLEKIELVVAEGNSTDATPQILADCQRDHPELTLKIVANPLRNTAIGRNLCLQHSTGTLVLNFSGHSIAAPNLLSVLTEKMAHEPEDVAGVGCAIEVPESTTFIERALGVVLASPLGGRDRVDSNFSPQQEQYTRSTAFTLYRRPVLDLLEGFDPEFWCGQDAELNLRLRQAGYRILYTPDTRVYHYKRSSFSAFVLQMYRYGVARAKLIKKHPDARRMVFLLPSLFVICVGVALAASFFSQLALIGTAAAAVLFAMVSFWSAAAAKGTWLGIAVSPLLYASLYAAYGCGFAAGWLYHHRAREPSTSRLRGA